MVGPLGNTVKRQREEKVAASTTTKVIAGFAGGTADAVTLFELLNVNWKCIRALVKAAVERWRKTAPTVLRKLEALLAVADETTSLIITGNGDVVRHENDLIAISSSGPYARAAAFALCWKYRWRRARKLLKKALDIAGDICIYITISTPLKN